MLINVRIRAEARANMLLECGRRRFPWLLTMRSRQAALPPSRRLQDAGAAGSEGFSPWTPWGEPEGGAFPACGWPKRRGTSQSPKTRLFP